MKQVRWLMGLVVFVLAACGGGDKTDDIKSESPAALSDTTTASPENVDETIAAVVNGQAISREVLALEVERQASMGNLAANPDTFATEVLEKLIDQVLFEQFALENDLVSEAEVQSELEALQAEAASHQVTLADLTGYPESMTEQKVREALYARAVIDYLSSAPVTQVHARHILVKNAETAVNILEQLAGGADFAELAKEFSKDGSTATAGGDLGWIAPGDLFQPEVEAIVFALDVNSRWPEPIASALGYHVVEVLERDSDRELTPEQRFKYEQQAVQAWLESQRAEAVIVRYVGDKADSPE